MCSQILHGQKPYGASLSLLLVIKFSHDVFLFYKLKVLFLNMSWKVILKQFYYQAKLQLVKGELFQEIMLI